MCACNHGHMMVIGILLNVAIQQCQHFLSMFFVSSPSYDANCDGVLGSPSSSTWAPSFYLINVSQFASYF